MDEEQEKEIIYILSKTPSESSWIDYKEEPYYKKQKADFIKDINGFLNSNDKYGKNGYIIFGIVDKTKVKKGIKDKPMLDDNCYQQWCENIQPRPHIETGTYKFEENEFGYIIVCKDNEDRVYSIINDVPKEKVTREEEELEMKTKVYASTAYIREGSRTIRLNEYDRRRIYENDRLMKEINKPQTQTYYSNLDDDETKDILKICALFGKWNDKNENEKKVISEVIEKEYDVWIKKIKRLLSEKSEYVTYKNNTWEIKNKEKLIELYSEEYFDSDIIKFRKATIKVLSEESKKLELEIDKRRISSYYVGNDLYSNTFKKSCIETFTFMKSILSKFLNCKNELNNSFYQIVHETLENKDWKIFATLKNILIDFAELNSSEYLKQLNELLKEDNNLKCLLDDSEDPLFKENYIYGIIWSLELISWNANFIHEAFNIFSKLYIYYPKIIDEMSRILLPWYPQTHANFEIRISVVKTCLKEYPDVGWKLLMKLMPNVVTNTSPISKPKWNNIPKENDNVTTEEVLTQYNEYIKIAIENSDINITKLKDLIHVLEHSNKNQFDEICKKLLSDEIKRIKTENRYILWNEIQNIIAKHSRFSTSEWALPKEALDKLNIISNQIKPKSPNVYLRRVFNTNMWDFYDNTTDSYEEMEKKITIQRAEAIKIIYNKGIDNIIKFASKVDNKKLVGESLANIDISKADEEYLLNELNKDSCEISKGYVKNKYKLLNDKWLQSLDLNKLNINGKVNFYTQLPNSQKTWDLVKIDLSKYEIEYWKKVDIRIIYDNSDVNYAIQKLNEADRPIRALELIYSAIISKKQYSLNLAGQALLLSLKHQEEIGYVNNYDIQIIIKNLQDNNYNEDELFKIEWAYLALLDDYSECKPRTIEKRICTSPTVFNELLGLAYKRKNDKEKIKEFDDKVYINAYRMLKSIKNVPGYDDKGEFDVKEFNNWLSESLKIAKENDRIEVAQMTIGHILYYSKKDKDGFWIEKNIAEVLNKEENEEFRNAYCTEAFNSVGVVNCDENGTAWINLEKKWKKRADLCQKDYFRFANSLRGLADDFHAHAEYEKEHYYDNM